VADAHGKDLFIQVIALTDPTPGADTLWHVAVNNPTDQPVTTVLENNMHVPEVTFTRQPVQLAPGE
jgi:hypothetical protein